MKKMITAVTALLLLLMLPLGVRADVIYEPWDSFFEEHRADCEYHSRSYTAVGPNGDVTLYESPESAWEEKTIPNGEAIWISYSYTDADGIRWGCSEIWNEDIIGWVPMDYLELIYDGISFDEEYGDQYVQEDGQLDIAYRGQTVYFWDYPGCETSHWMTLGEYEEYMPEYWARFTDADGKTWGKIGYYMGNRDCWICLDNPTADFDVLYPDGIATEPAEEPAPTEGETVAEIVPKKNDSAKLTAIAAVSATVAVTAVLLVLLKKKKH